MQCYLVLSTILAIKLIAERRVPLRRNFSSTLYKQSKTPLKY